MRGLYAIVDVGTLTAARIDPLRFAESVLSARPCALQLRAKDVPAREVLALLRAMVPLCRRAKVPLVANDRADLASFAGCDIVHIGQEDIPVDLVRRIASGLGVGISTHTIPQLQLALAARPTYVAFGPVFHTTTKANPSPSVGLDGLREAATLAKAAGIPLVAIGGITLERASEVAAIADAAAVVAALMPGASRDVDVFADVARRAQVLQDALTRRAPAPIEVRA